MKTITILSGKGGVGKSSLTASLAIALSGRRKIIVADCDVDASNLALVFGVKTRGYKEWKEISTNQRPVFDLDKCDACRKCFDNCYFESIKWEKGQLELLEYSCEGCGVCELICPQKAVKLQDVMNARIGYADTKYGFKIALAQLEVGESGSGKVVSEVRQKAAELAADAELTLIDSAAGISCPVIASVTGSDYCLLVAEPTPSSLADMKKALALVRHFGVPHGIVINKFDVNRRGYKRIVDFARRQKMEILGKLPYDKVFVDSLVNMPRSSRTARV